MTQHKATVQFVLFSKRLLTRLLIECQQNVDRWLKAVYQTHKTNIKGARKFQPDRSLDPLHSGPKPGWERRRVGRSAMQQTHPVTTTYAKDTIDFQEQGVACSRLKHETGKRGSSNDSKWTLPIRKCIMKMILFLVFLIKSKYKMNRIGFQNCWISDSLKRNKNFWNND